MEVNVCLLCLGQFDPTGVDTDPRIYWRFLNFLSRHLKIKTANFRNDISPPFCEECFGVVESLCQVYHQMQECRLRLEWRLERVLEKVRQSKERGSWLERRALIKDLSVQMKVMSGRKVDLLRKQLTINGISRRKKAVPRVTISPEIHQRNAAAPERMRQFLQSLIAVYTLNQMPPTPGNIPTKAEVVKRRRERPCPKSKKRMTLELDDDTDTGHPVTVKLEHPVVVVQQENENEDAYSPSASPPGSPEGAQDEEGDEDGAAERGQDSDWSAGGASNHAGDSDPEFSLPPKSSRVTRGKAQSTKQDVTSDDPDKPFACHLCPRRFPHEEGTGGLKRHLSQAHIGKKKSVSCNLCSKSFTSEGGRGGLKRHLSVEHGILSHFTCPKCPSLRFQMKYQLTAHLKAEHPRPPDLPRRRGCDVPPNSVPSQCPECLEWFPAIMKMRRHRRLLHQQGQDPVPPKEGKGPVNPKELLTCPQCGKQVHGRLRLEDHLKAHQRPDRPFRCPKPKCCRSFQTEEGLARHLQRHEDNPDPNYCAKRRLVERREKLKCDKPGCDKEFNRRNDLLVHQNFHCLETEYRCTVCDFTGTTLKEFRKHLLTHELSEEKHHFCPFCEESFTHPQTFDLHQKIAHPTRISSPFLCDVDSCSFTCSTFPELRLHLKNSHLPPGGAFVETQEPLPYPPLCLKSEEPSLYTCARCTWPFVTPLNYALHLLLHTPRNPQRLYPCLRCPQQFSVVDSLQQHCSRLHGPPGVQPHLCLLCGQRFYQKEGFHKHLQIHEMSNSPGITCVCEECGLVFKGRKSLLSHQIQSHGNDQVCRTCPFCPEGTGPYPTVRQMAEHCVKEHDMQKPYRCSVPDCGQSYLRGEHLRRHKLSAHEGVKPPPSFQCDECPSTFERKDNLKKHQMVIHQGVKNCVCEFCGKAWKDKSALAEHVDAVHRKLKPWLCEVCGKGFGHKSARKVHMKTHRKKGDGEEDARISEIVEEVLENATTSTTKQASPPHQ